MRQFKRILMVFMLLIVANTAVAAGTVGSQGPTGPAGAKGSVGLKGDKGLEGAVGSVGATGAKGATGPKGDKGEKGPAGASQGLQGVQGRQGQTGARGPAGSAQAGGNTAGDMQYWDGSQWQVVAPPSPLPVAPAMATLHFCNGLPTWAANCLPVQTTVYSIGATGPAGGIVFYLTDNTGLHGLEAAPANINNDAWYTWGCWGYANNNYTYTAVGNTGTSVGTGAANTAAIMAACGSAGGLGNVDPLGMGTASNAAAAADAYVLNGFTDWYLPSKDELNFLYAQKFVVGGFADDYYWSSSENSSTNAWGQYFTSGNQSHGSKYVALPVRAVRAF